MRKAIVFLVAAGLALAACIVNSFDDASATVAAPEGRTGTDGLGGEITFPADSDVGTMRFVIPAEGDGSGAARSVSGAGLSDVKSVGRGVRNIYQLVAVDESNPNAVWGFAEVSGSGGTLSVGILKGHTYRFLFLAGHADDAGLTLLASGYRKAKMTTEAGSSRFSLLMTPLVVDAAFVRNGTEGEARQVGRLAKTVGLDANASYTFRVVLGDDEAGALAPDDALRAAKSTKRYGGITPLIEAQAGESDWGGELLLVSNAAWFGGTPLTDWNDANKAGAPDKPHTTRGTAEYLLPTPAADEEATAYFKMEYAPFGLADNASWTAATGNAAPIWTIRNGLNDVAQTAATFDATGAITDYGTDFANYAGGPSTSSGTAADGKPVNANGALNVAVVDAAARPAGLFEDNNPWPIATAMTGASANDLAAALTFLNTNGAKGKYGAYTIRLGVDPTLPAYPGSKITLGDSGADWAYQATTNTTLIIEGTTPVVVPGRELLWSLNSGNTVRHGSGITPPIVITPGAGSLDSAFSVTTMAYAVSVPASVDAVTFTALALDASAAVGYDAGSGYSETPPLATLSGLAGSVTFSVKVTTAATERIWGPYTFDVSRPLWTVEGSLVYETFDGADYEGIKFTGETGALSFALPMTVDLLVVAGGGGGGNSGASLLKNGGGGAGGLIYKTGYALNPATSTVIVGSGGLKAASIENGITGSPGGLSQFGDGASRFEAPGGGGGAIHGGGKRANGGAGGSGGGSTASGTAGGAVTNFFYDNQEQPPDGITAFGNRGGTAIYDSSGAGGGGAGGVGANCIGSGVGANGGIGKQIDITGANVWYAAGGAGSAVTSYNTEEGYGANGGNNGAVNTGGGGSGQGGNGGSGIVIIRWAK